MHRITTNIAFSGNGRAPLGVINAMLVNEKNMYKNKLENTVAAVTPKMLDLSKVSCFPFPLPTQILLSFSCLQVSSHRLPGLYLTF